METRLIVCGGVDFTDYAMLSREVLSRNLHAWYRDAEAAKLWRPVLKEITFLGFAKKVGEAGNPFKNANVAVTGTVNGMNRREITDLLQLLGANITDEVTKHTTYLIVGENPGTAKLSAALASRTKIVVESQLVRMLGDSDLITSE